MERCQPVYEATSGWQEDLCPMRQWNELPPAVVKYIQIIEDFCKIPVTRISVGSERSAVINRN